jgi:hypothetical protein
MAVTQPGLAEAIARDFARIVPPEAHLSRLFVSSEHGYIHPDYDYVELAAFVDPGDAADDEQLLKAIGRVEQMYPDVQIMVYSIGPHVPGGRTREQWVRPEAEEVALNKLRGE